jgi:ATP-dependent DNA helicase RecG
MDALELYDLITNGEDSFTEFKSDVSQRSDFAGEMIAFANVEGGQILVGVDDSGKILGVGDPSKVEESIISIARDNCKPPLTPLIDRVQTDQGLVLVVRVPRRTGMPHENNSGQCYLRVGNTKRLASPQERARLLQNAGMVHFDETPVLGTSFDDIDLPSFTTYYQSIYDQPLENSDVPLRQMLRNMRFLVDDLSGAERVSLAGLLLFGKRPQDHLYYARISAVRWDGVEAREKILDQKEIFGRLPEQIDEAVDFIIRNTRQSGAIEQPQQVNVDEYPKAALREAIVNAVAHRDYSLDGAQILLYVFDNRLEVRSPGVLPNSVTLENIRTHFSRPRNETIARALLNLRYVNTLGSGVPRMIALLKEHSKREPDLELSSAQFLVRFWSKLAAQ